MLVFFPLESEGAATVRPDCVRSSPPLPDRRLLPASSLPQSVRRSRLGFGGGAAVAGGSTAASCRATTSARRGAGLQEGRGHDVRACWQLACDCLLQFANLQASTNRRSHSPQRQAACVIQARSWMNVLRSLHCGRPCRPEQLAFVRDDE
ncbi:hypothetical protein GQ55_2G020000 [Panicum hallii var. hallii]|uniref:Uncharacterized protein n=1 Tax=Panicum hallii var. hallii TaxID=1504633 RepID=A0A2T7EKL8_9POAL|nr:hypothetical protein GQ55_2G020000 [Panicum hallii var. hallii]